MIIIIIACSGSGKYPVPSPWKVIGIFEGRGISKAKVFKGKYETKLAFPEGWGGAKPKILVGMDIFWNNTLFFHFTLNLQNNIEFHHENLPALSVDFCNRLPHGK